MKVVEYYQKRLGDSWWLYLGTAGLSWFVVLLLAAQCMKVYDGQEHNDAVAVMLLTLITGALTCIDLVLLFCGNEPSCCRVTPLTIACGIVAMFLGLKLYTQNENSEQAHAAVALVSVQAYAVAVQMAAIFNATT